MINALNTVTKWHSLGIQLGIRPHLLDKIKSDERDKVEPCKTEMLTAWLKQVDYVLKVGNPSWSILKTALKHVHENKVANELPQKQHTCSTEH